MRIEQIKKAILAAVLVLGFWGSAWATDGLISYWAFDEGNGGTAYDSAGDNDGTIYGASWVDGALGGALDFDGMNDYVNIGRPSSLANMGRGAIELWFKPSFTIDDSLGKYVRLIEKNAWGGNDPGDTVLGFALASRYRGTLYFYIINEAGTVFPIHSDNDYWPAGVWQHVVVTWDNATGTIRMYVNGVEQQEKLNSFTGIAMGADRDVVIGAGSERTGGWFNGVIDEVKIYDNHVIEVAVDIKPGSCPNPLNLKSRGVLPVAILGSEDFNVNTIDIASIRLAGVAPLRNSFEDVAGPGIDANDCDCNTVGPDSFTDVVLKFKTQEIVEQIYFELDGDLVEGDWLELLLTGQLVDHTPFEGTDCVVIVGTVPQSLGAKKADINQDGLVDAFDFSWLGKHWLQSSR